MKKIVFTIGGLIEVYEYDEILKSDFLAYDKDFFYLIRAIEKNPKFVEAISRARKKLNIPAEGYDWLEYSNSVLYPEPDTKEQREKVDRFEEKVKKEAYKIYKSLKLTKELKWVLPDIITSNCVHGTGPAIHFETDDDFGYYPERVKAGIIRIQKRVSKNQLHRYIEDNWKGIRKVLKHLPAFSSAYISERDMFIVNLRDKKKMTYKDIATEIIRRFKVDDPEAKINEDSVKTAYKRAKNKIKSLIKER